MTKLYTGKEYRAEGMSHIPLLHPFWGVILKDTMPYVKAALEKHSYAAASTLSFVLVDSIDEADFVVIPHPYRRLLLQDPEKIAFIEREARAAGKLILADGSGDLPPQISASDYLILRSSSYRYSFAQNEIMIPLMAEDLLESYCGGRLEIRTKVSTPSVSFAGWGALSFMERLKTLFKELPLTLTTLVDSKRRAEHKGVLWRERALKVLSRVSGVEGKFIIRDAYAGHVSSIEGSVEKNRRDFVDNLLGADYALVVRGDGNTSYRLYEALSLGRIPLILDTAYVFPLEEKIRYHDFCVFVDWRDIDSLGERLLQFHARVTPEKFQRMQRAARAAFEGYLRPDSFVPHLAEVMGDYAKRYYAGTRSQ